MRLVANVEPIETRDDHEDRVGERMIYAVVYAENGDTIGTYGSRDEAVRKLAAFVSERREVQDQVGLRPYENGRPGGAYDPAVEVLGDHVAQRPLF